MRIRVMRRPLLAVAAAVAVVSLGTAHLSPTYASPPQYLTANDFHEVALQGFGDPQNSWAWSMKWFNNKLYVGTNRDYICAVFAMFNRQAPSWLPIYPPPPDPNLAVPCPANPQALPEAGEIWSMDPGAGPPFTQTNWTEVYQSPYTVTVNITHTSAITQAPRDIAFRGMSIFNDPDGTPVLYASGIGSKPLNGPNVPPPSLLRTTDGAHFQAVPADPGTTLGSINSLPYVKGACCMRGQASLNGRFYLLIGKIQGSGTVFASPAPWQGDNSFQQITPPGMDVFEMQPFSNTLYLGVQSTNGYQVWKTTCTAPPAGQPYCPMADFTQIVPNGGGLGSKGNGGITSMHVYTDTAGIAHLYVGTDGTDDTSYAQPAEIIRINGDDSWDLIVGKPRKVNNVMMEPMSGLGSGFGWYFNVHMWRMADYNGVLYVGTNDESTLFMTNPQYQSLQPWVGFDLWASPDGITFFPVTQNGFGDPFSYGGRSLEPSPYGLFVGSANHYQGLRVWLGSVPQSAISLAPANLQTDAVDNKGTTALAWDPSPNATVYHVYRAMSSRVTVPKQAHADPTSGEPSAKPKPLHWPRKVWKLDNYIDIGTVTTPYFVDHNPHGRGRATYYVIAQDANGNLSAPSNVATDQIVLHLPTFRYMAGVLTYWAQHGKITSAQALSTIQSLQAAYARLQAGDAQGSHDQVEALRQQLVSNAQTPSDRLRAEITGFLLKKLEKRIMLVNAHVLSLAKIS